MKPKKSKTYHLIDILIYLVLTILVSTTMKRAFLAMKIVKTIFHYKMADGILANNLIVYIEIEFAMSFNLNLILDDFVKKCRMQFNTLFFVFYFICTSIYMLTY